MVTHLSTDVCVAATHELFNFVAEITGHFFGCNVGERAKGEADDIHVGVVHVVLEAVGNEGQYFRVLIQQEHDAKIAEPLVGEPGCGHEFEALDLTKVSGVAEHVDIEELCNVVVSGKGIFVLEGGPDGRRLLLDERSLVGEGLARPNGLDQRLEVVETGTGHETAEARVKRSNLLLFLEECGHVG